ncbi:MAG: sulfatase/phosphatase domain-containing protein, partial [Halobacteriaceae archaeon]
SHLEPHHQNDMETYVAPDGYAEEYENPWVPPDLEGRPGDWYAELPDYYGICARIDECFGRLLGALNDAGVREETVVLFTSDHGCHFRTRNGEYKRSCHDASIRVPAFLDGPGFEGGATVEEPVSLLDVPPTLLDAAGIDVPDAYQGDSVLPLVGGETDDWKDDVLVQVSETAVERTLRTERWKYSVYAPDADGWEDPAADEYVERYLYDLRADPHETVNLVGRPDHRDVADDLRERLRDRLEAAGEGRPEIRAAEYHA